MAVEEIDLRLKTLLTPEQAHRFRVIPKRIGQKGIELWGESVAEQYLPQLRLILGKPVAIDVLEEGFEERLLRNYPFPNPSSRTNQGQVLAPDTVRLVDKVLEEAAQMGASDIHVERYESEARIRYRWEGQLIEKYEVPPEQYNGVISRLKILADLDISERRLPQDGRINMKSNQKSIDVRVSTIPGKYGEKMVLRLLTRSSEHLDLAKVGFSSKELAFYRKAVATPNGIVLITGPTGSGKTTTLYATLNSLNEPHRNILTIEDPIEYNLTGINQVQLKEEIGLTFDRALRAFLRQDPDIIMVGEIRDTATAQIAIRAALTGHLVFSTLHTNGSWDAITRLTDMGVEPYLLAAALRLVLAQRLVRVLCPHCKRPSKAVLASAFQAEHDIEVHQEPTGCPHCYYTGYLGRRAVFELLPVRSALRKTIKTGEGSLEHYLKQQQLPSLSENLVHLVKVGETSLTEAMLHFDQD